jgi:hypothetical protein
VIALDVMQPDTANSLAPELATSAVALAAGLANCQITAVADLELAVADRDRIAALKKTVVDYFAPIKSMAYKLHRTICDRENVILQPLEARDRAIRDAMSAFKVAEDRARQEREREEQDRQHREQQAAAVHEAAALEASGQAPLAAAVLEDAIQAPPPVVALPDVTRGVSGLKFAKRWKWKYTGGPADVKATPAPITARTMKLIPREFLIVDEVKVGAYVRSMKSSGSIPGIEIYSVDEPVR